MSELKPGFYAIVTAAILFCTVAALTGAKAAQDKNTTGGLKIAVVDVPRVLAGYTYTDVANKELSGKQRTADDILRAWGTNYLLSEKDQNDLADLITQENSPAGLTDAQKTRKAQLLDQSKTLLDEFDTLRNKKVGDLNAADNARLTALMKLVNDTDLRIKARKQKSDADLQQQYGTASDKVKTDVKTALTKVAKEKGYNLVFSGDVALYADNDITDAVLAQLNKK